MNSFLVKAESTATLHQELVHESSLMEQLYIISTSAVSVVQLTMKRGTQPEKSQYPNTLPNFFLSLLSILSLSLSLSHR